MRVAFVTEFCPPYRTAFYETFDDRFDAKVFFCDTREKWQSFGDFTYEVMGGVRLRPRYNVAYPLFWKLFRYGPDVIVGSPVEGFGGQAAYLYAKLTRTPFVLWTGEWHLPLTTFRTVTFPVIRRIYRGSDAIVVYGPHVEHYLTDLGVSPERIHVAWNTVDVEKFSNPDASDSAAVRAQFGVPADAKVVLYVGRLVEEKGIEYLLDGFERFQETTDDECHLLVVGEGDRRSTLEGRVGGRSDVTFTGRLDNDALPDVYVASDVFVLPSITTDVFKEPWGLVVNEAMAAGLPIVATSSVGAANAGLVQDGENGFVVPERNERAIADRLHRILDDESVARQMGERSREIIGEFDHEHMVDGFERAIETATSVHR